MDDRAMSEPPADHQAFFDLLLPLIEENVRENEMLCPVVIFMVGDHTYPISLGEFFDENKPHLKDRILPFIQTVLKLRHDVDLVAFISEVWMATLGNDEEVRKHRDSGKAVCERDDKVDGVICTIYDRNDRDSMFSMRIKPDRIGVERGFTSTNLDSEGRFMRDNPSDN